MLEREYTDGVVLQCYIVFTWMIPINYPRCKRVRTVMLQVYKEVNQQIAAFTIL